ncbi:histidine-phosphotransfer domain, HPT domain-containing protein [Exidia glandulosa HHB12029]|uniref:Histidine-phosphotransfer domain, HPT domain-containing protein n=1 Tax=Exidia glandulosa HHB12029 TaxID=1314781 RepID=A0A165DJH2_EXIGL|nr:histidine-phosphotransfer domain, HPT domain-containing protein [Exidia glandulosa HHB12029]
MATTAGTRDPPRRSSPFADAPALHDRSSLGPSAPSTTTTTTTTAPVSPPKPAAASSPPPAAEAAADELPSDASDVIIDMDTFGQILELEEDDTYDFSIGMTEAYFSQAETTFKDMDKALAANDLKRLSELGHFLKGSSAALGVHKVQESCERMQNYGKLLDDNGEKKLKEDDALSRITKLLARVKVEYTEAEKYLKEWYTQHGASL